jgi:GT2 family glycosyltransferase
MTEKIGLVTVLFNSADVLPGFFESLSRQDFDNYYLYIIDNSLDDLSYKSSEALIEQYGMKNVMLIKNAENVGVAKGNNQGIELALENACEYVLLLNNDIEFDDPALLSKMLEVAKSRNEKLVVPKIYFFDSGNIWCAGGAINHWTGTTTHRGEGEADTAQYNTDGRTNYAPTCFMLIHQSVFKKIGMMDEKYFVYYDDTDFVWRANHGGFGIYYWAAGEVKHKVSSSTGGSASTFTTYYAQRNRLYFIRKNFKFSMKVISLTYYFLTRLLKWQLFSKKLRKPFFSAVADGLKM